MKKMIVSDYDNTFYRSNEDIEKNKLMVGKFMGFSNIFVIATGRSYMDFKKKEELYNIKYNYLIINHGATILKDDKVVFNEVIDNNIKNELLSDLKLEDTILSFACSKLDSRVSFSTDNLTKIHVKYETKEITKQVYFYIKDKYNNFIDVFFVTENEAIEIVSNKVNKSNAIDFIAKLENINNDNIYTIGDSYNDINMINNYNGSIMKDSIDELKKKGYKEYDSVSILIKDVLEIEV